MTTAPDERETRRQGVARRIRGLMGEHQLRGEDMARRLAMSQPTWSRRVNGHVPFSIDEIEQLSQILGESEAYLYGFTNERTPARETRTGVLYGIRDSNPEPADSEHVADLSVEYDLEQGAVVALSEAPSFRLPGDPRTTVKPPQVSRTAVATVTPLRPRTAARTSYDLGFALPDLLAVVIPFTRTEQSA